MTEPDPPHAAEPTPDTPPMPDDTALSGPGWDPLPWLCGLGFLLLAGAIGFVWHSQPVPPPPAQPSAAVSEQVQMLETRVAQLEQRPVDPDRTALMARVGSLEHRATGTVDVTRLTARLDALEQQAGSGSQLAARVTALEQKPAGDSQLVDRVAALEQRATGDNQVAARVAALEQRPTGDNQLAARVAALEQKPTVDDQLAARVAALEQRPTGDKQLASRVDALADRIEALSSRGKDADAEFGHRLDAIDTRLGRQEPDVGQAVAQVDRVSRLARIQAARTALAGGEKLGDIPGAPREVARFAATPPPTEAALRLAFPSAAKAALEASRPDMTGQPFLSRVLARTEDLVTVWRGDRVLVGDRAAEVLARARTALDAGDLAGAVAAISALSGPAADAMANWQADAKELLDARTGLAGMAAHD